MSGRILAVAGIACCAAAPAAAADARQPTARWNVEFDDAQCVATRNYGSDEDPLYLVVKAPPLGDVLKIAVVRKGQVGLPNQVEGEITFDDNPPIRITLLESGVKELGHRVLSVNLPTRELAPMRTASTLRIRAREEDRPVVGSRVAVGMRHAAEEFALSQMAPLLKVVDKCVADLRKVWNVSPADAPSPHLKQHASGDLQGVFRDDDYPAEAMYKNMEGQVQFALLIDETGGIADCTVIKTSGVAVLDAQSCGIVRKRARFKPALGLDGKPAKDGLVQRVTWRIAS